MRLLRVSVAIRTTKLTARHWLQCLICFSEINILGGGGDFVADEPIIMTGFVRWKPGYPISDEKNNCGAFDIDGYILDIPCGLALPYVCEIPEK
jgi:hypothetical protein